LLILPARYAGRQSMTPPTSNGFVLSLEAAERAVFARNEARS